MLVHTRTLYLTELIIMKRVRAVLVTAPGNRFSTYNRCDKEEKEGKDEVKDKGNNRFSICNRCDKEEKEGKDEVKDKGNKEKGEKGSEIRSWSFS